MTVHAVVFALAVLQALTESRAGLRLVELGYVARDAHGGPYVLGRSPFGREPRRALGGAAA